MFTLYEVDSAKIGGHGWDGVEKLGVEKLGVGLMLTFLMQSKTLVFLYTDSTLKKI